MDKGMDMSFLEVSGTSMVPQVLAQHVPSGYDAAATAGKFAERVNAPQNSKGGRSV